MAYAPLSEAFVLARIVGVAAECAHPLVDGAELDSAEAEPDDMSDSSLDEGEEGGESEELEGDACEVEVLSDGSEF